MVLLLLCPFHKGGDWSIGTLSNLPKSILVSGGLKVHIEMSSYLAATLSVNLSILDRKTTIEKWNRRL